MLIKVSTDVMARFKKVYEAKVGKELKKLLEYSEAVEDVLLSYIAVNETASTQVVEQEKGEEFVDDGLIFTNDEADEVAGDVEDIPSAKQML
jgi:hypothetical protein